MRKQELIKRIEDLPYTEGPIADTITINRNWILESIEQLDEPEMGHADEAPRYVKNILARLRELPLHDCEVWLKAIMGEFEQDFSHAKWREGYEQGKFEGVVEREKFTIPQFVADWIANVKRNGFKFRNTSGYYEEIAPSDDVYRVMYYIFKEGIVGEKIKSWINENRDVFARAWLDGYDIQETKYVVTDGNHLYFKKCQEDIEIVILVDEQPGTMEYVKKFDTKEEAQEIANILGWKVQEVE
jgi:hypothetical protein